MKVLYQEWMTDHGHKVSISKDKAQLDQTIADLKAEDRGEPSGESTEVEISEDTYTGEALAEMVENNTVFLNRDEEELIVWE